MIGHRPPWPLCRSHEHVAAALRLLKAVAQLAVDEFLQMSGQATAGAAPSETAMARVIAEKFLRQTTIDGHADFVFVSAADHVDPDAANGLIHDALQGARPDPHTPERLAPETAARAKGSRAVSCIPPTWSSAKRRLTCSMRSTGQSNARTSEQRPSLKGSEQTPGQKGLIVQGVRCWTKRAAIATRVEAVQIAARVAKGATAQQCPYCGWWHVVGMGSSIEHPSKPRRRR